MQSTILGDHSGQLPPEIGRRAGYDEAKRKKGSKTHIAVDTLGDRLTLLVPPANERLQPSAATDPKVQEVTSETVEVAFGDGGYTLLL